MIKEGVDIGCENALETISSIYYNKLQMIRFQPRPTNSESQDKDAVDIMSLADYINVFFSQRAQCWR